VWEGVHPPSGLAGPGTYPLFPVTRSSQGPIKARHRTLHYCSMQRPASLSGLCLQETKTPSPSWACGRVGNWACGRVHCPCSLRLRLSGSSTPHTSRHLLQSPELVLSIFHRNQNTEPKIYKPNQTFVVRFWLRFRL
jgi:hypothetical protein